MKYEKKIATSLATVLCLVWIISSALFVNAASTSNMLVISPGVYPGAASYTVYSDSGGTYYAKDQYGAEVSKNTNAQTVLATVFALGGEVKLMEGDYTVSSLTVTRNLELTASVGARLISSGNQPAIIIDLDACYDYKQAQGLKAADVTLKNIVFVGTAITDPNIPFIDIRHARNIVNVNVKTYDLQFINGQRGIYQNSSYIWYAMGCFFLNTRTVDMRGASLFFNCVTDAMITNMEVYNTDVALDEPGVILNSLQSGAVFASGVSVNGLTILGKLGGTQSCAMMLNNKAVHISNLEIDTTSGDGLCVNGTYNIISNFEINAARGNGITNIGGYNEYIGGAIRESHKNGIEVVSGAYIHIVCNIINSGQEIDNTYYDVKINNNSGENSIIQVTTNSGNANRPAYGVYLGQNSYGICDVTNGGARNGAVIQQTSKRWSIKATYNSGLYEQYGVVNVPGGLSGTKYAVSLNMAFAPTVILLQGTTGASTAASYDSGNKTASYFNINVPTDNAFTMSWYAKYIP